MEEAPGRREKMEAGANATLAVLTLSVWAAVVLSLWPTHGRTFNWDEVDYVYAARAGVAANALERELLHGCTREDEDALRIYDCGTSSR